jgi:hypothetical protein
MDSETATPERLTPRRDDDRRESASTRRNGSTRGSTVNASMNPLRIHPECSGGIPAGRHPARHRGPRRGDHAPKAIDWQVTTAYGQAYNWAMTGLRAHGIVVDHPRDPEQAERILAIDLRD